MMEKLTIVLILSFSFKAYATNSYGQFDSSQFYGSWSWVTATNCVETYIFREDGILQIKSGEELTDSTYQITEAKKIGQLAKLSFRTIKDYGGKDCGNTTSDSTGQSAEMYIGIVPGSSEMLNCDTVEGIDCWHLKKVKP